MTRRRALLIAPFATCLRAFAEDEPRRDGNWWRTLNLAQRTNHLIGFFDGMELGAKFVYWGDPKNPKIDGVAAKSYDDRMERYFKNVTNFQISDGLTKFYEDYRNRSITIDNGVWLVVNAISGKSDAEMQTLIENFRKNTK